MQVIKNQRQIQELCHIKNGSLCDNSLGLSVTHCRHKQLYLIIQRFLWSVSDWAVALPKEIYFLWCTKWNCFLSTQTVGGMEFLKLKNSENSCLLPLCIYILFLKKAILWERNSWFWKKRNKKKLKTKLRTKSGMLIIRAKCLGYPFLKS